MLANVAENIAAIVTTAIAIRPTSSSHEAASATSFGCEASHAMKDGRMLVPVWVAAASTPTRGAHGAPPATSFGCEESHAMKDGRMLVPVWVAAASPAIVPNM